MSLRHAAAAIAAVCFVLGGEEAGAARGTDPVGTWSCVVWGHPEFGDERVLFNFAPEGVARLARIETDAVPSWTGLTPWVTADREMRFSDPRTGRHTIAPFDRDVGGPSEVHERTDPQPLQLAEIVVGRVGEVPGAEQHAGADPAAVETGRAADVAEVADALHVQS